MNLPKEVEEYVYYRESDPDLIVLHGDCLEIMPLLPKVDFVVTDPPYGIDFHSAWPSEERKKDKIENDKFEDYETLLPKMLHSFKNILKDGGVCCCCGGGGSTPSLANLWLKAGEYLTVENVCIWNKGFIGLGWRYRFQWEAILIATKGERKTWNGGTNRSNIIELQKVIPQEGEHPTLKPVSLMRLLIGDNSNEGEIVCDPFLGSGTSLIACKELNRCGIGIEISEKYCQIAKRRLLNTPRPLFTDVNGAEGYLKESPTLFVMPSDVE